MTKQQLLDALTILIKRDPSVATEVLSVVGQAMEAFKKEVKQANEHNALIAISASLDLPAVNSWRVKHKRHRDGARLLAVGMGLHVRHPAAEVERRVLRFCDDCELVYPSEAKRHYNTLGIDGFMGQGA